MMQPKLLATVRAGVLVDQERGTWPVPYGECVCVCVCVCVCLSLSLSLCVCVCVCV